MKIQVNKDNLRVVPLLEIHLNPKNNNKHPEDQIDHLIAQFKYQGFRDPLIVSKRSGFVICGEGRFLAAKKAGMKELPVIYQDFESEAQEYAFLTAHNAVSRWSNLDLSQINVDIQDLGPDFDIEMLGIKDFGVDVSFIEGTLEDQDRLDQKQFTKCPSCGEEFDHAKNKA